MKTTTTNLGNVSPARECGCAYKGPHRSTCLNPAPRSAPCHPDRKYRSNGLCLECWGKMPEVVAKAKERWPAYYEKNRKKRIKQASEWAKANPEQNKKHAAMTCLRKRLKQLDLSMEQYKTMLEACGGSCQSCNRPARLVLDHDHATGLVRGLICTQCNTAIGMFRENPRSLSRAVVYLTGGELDFPTQSEVKPKTKYPSLNHRLKKFGLTLQEYEVLEKKQSGVCAICVETCSTGWRLAVDHDHVTGEIRGLLCFRCNRGVGLSGDDPTVVRSMASYLGFSLGAEA